MIYEDIKPDDLVALAGLGWVITAEPNKDNAERLFRVAIRTLGPGFAGAALSLAVAKDYGDKISFDDPLKAFAIMFYLCALRDKRGPADDEKLATTAALVFANVSMKISTALGIETAELVKRSSAAVEEMLEAEAAELANAVVNRARGLQ